MKVASIDREIHVAKSANSGGQQLQHDQQIEQSPLILNSLNFGNPDSGLGQAQKYGGLNRLILKS